jgi:NADH-ubiquinone oxidoreductase chain 2
MMSLSILIFTVAYALPLINKQLCSIHFIRLVSMVLLLSGLLSFNTLYLQSIGTGIGIYSGLFHITNIGVTMELFLLVIGSIILIGWPLKQSEYSKDYSLIVLFSILGSSLLISSSDLISFYLSLELQSFGLYILSTLYRNSESSTNAGLKYFLLGGLSSCIILLGTGIIYAYTGVTSLESLYILLNTTNLQYVLLGSYFGLVLIIIGLLFKISAAPLHNWSPDVYDETPTIVTIWLTIVPKIALLIFLLEITLNFGLISSLWQSPITGISDLVLNSVLYSSNSSLIATTATLFNGATQENIEVLKNLLLIVSLLSLIIGTVVGLAQIKIKRLLAYSTISHIGFMLLALAINTNQSIDSFLFYLIQYILTNLNIFLILLAISYGAVKTINSKIVKDLGLSSGTAALNIGLASYSTNKDIGKRMSPLSINIIDIKYLRDLQGLFYTNPILSLSLSLSLFSMAGIPPFIGFFSKQFVLYSALDSGYYFISFVAIIVSVISASYYLKIIKLLHSTISPNAKEESTTDSFGQNQHIGLSQETVVPNNNPLASLEGENLLSQFHSFLIALLSLFILLFILKPTLILNSTQVLSLCLFKL